MMMNLWIGFWIYAVGAFGQDLNFQFSKGHEEFPVSKDVKSWLSNIKMSVPESCGCTTDVDNNPRRKLLSFVSCQEPDAISKYSFKGQCDEQMIFSGIGVLTFDTNLPRQSICIRILKIFGETIETISGNFSNGQPVGKTLLGWKDVKAEIQIIDGTPCGMYRLEHGDRWAIGQLYDGNVNGSCWIVNKNYVKTGVCMGDPWTLQLGTNQQHPHLILTHNLNTVLSIVKEDEGRLVVKETKAEIRPSESTECQLIWNGVSYGSNFELDLKTLERNYDLEAKDIDPCSVIDSKAQTDESLSESIKNYFTNLTRISPDQSPVDNTRSKKFMTHVEPVLAEDGEVSADVYEAVFTLLEKDEIEFAYFGEYDENRRFHGQAILKRVKQSGHDFYKGKHRDPMFKQIHCTFVHGVLQGLVVMTSASEDTTTYFILTDGVVHSLVVQLGATPHYPCVKDQSWANSKVTMKHHHNGIGFLSKFVNGKVVGPVWYGMIGEEFVAQGFLHSRLNKKGKMSGESVAYLYPDYLTALLGTFEDKLMVSAKKSKVVGMTCEKGLLALEFQRPDLDSPSFYFEQRDHVTIGSNLLTRDPYEAMTVEVGQSTVENSGQGIFALRNISKFQVVAMYNGVVFDKSQRQTQLQRCIQKQMKSQQEKYKKCMKNWVHGLQGEIIDVPEEYDSVSKYNASLGHKCNNHFDPYRNAIFSTMEHPRFGVIANIVSTQSISKGEEIFVDYKFDKNKFSYDWYEIQKEKVSQELKRLKEEIVNKNEL